jgi:mono/diheme cytochrome c family protein
MLLMAGAADADSNVERGRYLVETIAGCGNCHTPQGPQGPEPGKHLAGGLVIDEGAFRAVSPNITPDRETGIGAWSDAEIARAIREGIRPDGTVIGPPMPIGAYRGLSDADVTAMVAYLRTVPGVANTTEPSRYDFPLPPAYGPPVGSVKAPDPAEKVAYGAYLAGPVGHCLECHTPMLPGGQRDLAARLGWGGAKLTGAWGTTISADLTPTHLGEWTDAEIVRAVTQGISRDGRQLGPPMGYAYYAGMTERDLSALVAYLRTLPPSRR